MLLRPLEAEFAPRAQVFPGGRVDDADADPVWQRLIDLGDDPELTSGEEPARGDPPNRVCLVAAIREAFEETCVLLGVEAGAYPGPQWAGASRARVHAAEAAFAEVVGDAGLRLSPGRMTYFARWITPEGLPKRYDTRFFAAAMPEAQEAIAAAGEISSLEWVSPAVALDRADTSNAYTMPPTRAALSALASYRDVESALDGLRRTRDLTPIMPRILAGAEGPIEAAIRVVMPGEPGYDD